MRVISSVAEAITMHGYVLIRGYRPDAPSFEALSDFGQIDVVEGLNPIQTLIPRDKAEAPPNTYSGNFGVAEFPLHTDLAHWAVPPRFLALRCVRGSESIATRLLDGKVLVKRFRPDVLRTILVQPRRPMRNGKQLLQLLERVESSDQFRLRWDSVYLKPATGPSAELFANVLEFISRVQPAELVLLERGDTLVVDNWRFLHGRGGVTTNASTRQIHRAYLSSIS
jgi:alpha-ketoglutarate-dependent taurine dioxygenase